jgi:hypothetical protein
MKIINLLLLIFLSSLTSVNAQKFPFYKNFEWDKNPTIIDRHIEDELYYYNQYDIASEYIFDEIKGSFFKYEFFHYRVFLNKPASVDEFNKVYISLEDVHNILNLKARLIKTNGDIVNIEPEVEDFFNQEEQEEYQYFPISGIEVGDELEVMYTLKKNPQFNGDQEEMQGDIPIFNSNFYLICPKWMKFKFEALNGYPTPERLDTIIHMVEYYAHADTVPDYDQEYYSEYNNTIQKIEFALYKIKSDKKYTAYSPYESVTNAINKTFNIDYKNGTKKKLLKELKTRGINLSGKTEEMIKQVELFIKLNIKSSYKYEDQGVLETIKVKRTNVPGVIKLFKAIFEALEIKYQYGYISDRYDTHFSDQIESDYFLQNYFFYFPKVKKYMSPLSFVSRLGHLSADLIPNNALYITEDKTYKTSEYDVKPVPYVDYTNNTDFKNIDIRLDKNLKDVTVTIERQTTGYKSAELQAYYFMYSPNRKEEKLKDFLNPFNDARLEVNEVKNISPEDVFVKPLILKGTFTDFKFHLFDKADETLIFKLGNIFGDFIEIKEISERVSDYVFHYAFHNKKTITLHLPSNVKVSKIVDIPEFDNLNNLEGIEISSKIKVDGNTITYIKEEKYKKQRISKSEKDKMVEIFQFYNDLANMNIIIEKK